MAKKQTKKQNKNNNPENIQTILNRVIENYKDTYINKQYKGIKTLEDLIYALNQIQHLKKDNNKKNKIKELWISQNPTAPTASPKSPEKPVRLSPIAPIIGSFKRIYKYIIHYTEKAMNQIYNKMLYIDKFLDHLFTFMFKQLKYLCFIFLILLTLVFLFSKEKYLHMILAVYIFIYLILGFAIIGLIYALVALGKLIKKLWVRCNQVAKMKKIKVGTLIGLIVEIIVTFFAMVATACLVVIIALGSDYIKRFGKFLYDKLNIHSSQVST